MEDKFDMNQGFEIVDNQIIIDATPAFCSLYATTKNTVVDNSKGIDESVYIIDKIEKLLNFFSTYSKGMSNDDVKKELDNWKEFLNVKCFFMSCHIDFTISIRELVLAKNMPEQIYCIKNIYISLYRYLERIEPIRGIIRRISDEFGLYQDYKKYTLDIISFAKKYRYHISCKRSKLYAHIDNIHDYREYHKDVVSLKIDDEIKMCFVFFEASCSMSKFLNILESQIMSRFDELTEKYNKESISNIESIYAKIEKLSNSDKKSYTTTVNNLLGDKLRN